MVSCSYAICVYFFVANRFLHEEESPQVTGKRKRPSESQTPVAKISRKVKEDPKKLF